MNTKSVAKKSENKLPKQILETVSKVVQFIEKMDANEEIIPISFSMVDKNDSASVPNRHV